MAKGEGEAGTDWKIAEDFQLKADPGQASVVRSEQDCKFQLRVSAYFLRITTSYSGTVKYGISSLSSWMVCIQWKMLQVLF